MENAIPAGLVDQVPQLVVMLLVVGAIIGFMWRLWQSQSGLVREIVHRHEEMEGKQMDVLARNNEVIAGHTGTLNKFDATVGDLGREVRRLGERIGTTDFPLITQEPMTHRIASPSAEPHLGVPGGVFEPDVILSFKGLQQAGETAAWTVSRYGIDRLHAAGVKGEGAQVVVIDTGLDRHPDLAANQDVASSQNFVPGETIQDFNGHSTHCGGIVAADDNGVGVVGVAPDATLVQMKALNNRGGGAGTWIAAGIRAAADLPGHRILSCSFGADGEDPQISAAVRYAVAKGHWVVAAAGNSGPGSVNWPGAMPEVVCVGALDDQDQVARFSSANDFVDVGFGGVQILSTINGNRYAKYDGTSMATPGVAGVLALGVGELLKRNLPVPNQAVMAEVLYATCRDVGVPGRDPGAGYGLVQPAEFVRKLVERVQGPGPVDPPPPPPAGDTHTINAAELKAKGVKRVVIEL